MDKKVCVILLVALVSGLFHSSHGGLGLLCGRWFMMSDERRCGIFCWRHIENSRNLLC